jgi:hypothetical protein
MSLTSNARTAMERFGQTIQALSADDIERAIYQEEFSSIRDDLLSLGTDGDYGAFYAPFDWINDDADVVIVGVTPGKQQATEALQAMRTALVEGASIDETARVAKQAASFKGTMRTLGARLMDHFRFNEIFGLRSTIDLFGKASCRAHYTSVIRYPVLKKFKNYSGDRRILNRRLLKTIIDEHLPDELRGFRNAWIVPFGPIAHHVLLEMVARGVLDSEQVLGGILHPSGTQWNRYNVQLELIPEAEMTKVSGGDAVRRASNELHAKVTKILANSKVA